MNNEEIESPYCEICDHCGDIGCCGIENFIEYHIKGKTNCKNESIIIDDLIDLCEYKDDVFKENNKLREQINKIKNWFEEHKNQTINFDGMTVKETHIYDEILNLIKEYEDETKRV